MKTLVVGGMLIFASWLTAQQDPGVQAGTRFNAAGVPTGGNMIPASDTTGFSALWDDGLSRFLETQTVSGGLGPRFNSNSCVSCHAQPAPGGSGAAVNPQFTFAGSAVAPNDTTPFFITQNGPTLEARFPFFLNSAGQVVPSDVNGGVEDLFTVSGRSDAGSCRLSQPNFQAAAAAHDLVFRIPTPLFGLGLIENLDESTLRANRAVNLKNNLGIGGEFNHSGNDDTISRFGWKAQNKSLELFAGEAFNVEMGVSNQTFTQDRPTPEEDKKGSGLPNNCLNLTRTGYPEDNFRPFGVGLDDVSAFANFMRFNAPPGRGPVVLNGKPVPPSSLSNGQVLFTAIGCAVCHNPSPGKTGVSNFVSALSNQPVPAFSDIEIHHMGVGLNDQITQGIAKGDQFRTAPLWGLGQRIFLLHDGRTTDLVQAIKQHASSGSEANQVIKNFDLLTPSQQQDLLNFLRSL